MKRYFLLCVVLVLVPVWAWGAQAPVINPTYKSLRIDSTGSGRVHIKAKSGSGDSLVVQFYPVDSCGTLFMGGIGSTSKNFLYYTPCNSNDTIGLLSVSAAGDDTVKWLINVDTTASIHLSKDSIIVESVTGSHVVFKSPDVFSLRADSVGKTDILGYVTILGSLRLMMDTATVGDVRVFYPFDTTLAGGIPNGAGPFWNSANGQFEFTVPTGTGQNLGTDTGNGSQASFTLPTNTIFGPDSTTQFKFDDQATDTLSVTVVKIPDGAVSATGKIAQHVVDTSDLNVGNTGGADAFLTNQLGGAMEWTEAATLGGAGITVAAGPVFSVGSDSTISVSATGVGVVKIPDNSVDSAKIAAKGISTGDLQDTVVTAAKLKSASVDSIKLVDKGISTGDIQDTAVTLAKLKSASVDSVKLVDKGISTADLQDTVVTAAKIKSAVIDSTKLTDKGISTGDLQDTVVTAAKIKTGVVDSTKLTDKGVSTGDLQDTVVTTGKIKSSAVDSIKIADKGVSTADLQDTSVTAAKIDTHVIDTSKINVTNTGSAGQVLTKASGSNSQFTWATDQTGGAGASRIFVDSGNGSEAPVPMSDSLVLQGDTTFYWRYEDQLRDTVNGTVVKIPDGAVSGTAKIAAGAVELADLATGAVDSAKILDKGISTGDLQDTVVTAAKLKSGIVDSVKILDKGISTGDLQDTVVTAGKLKSASVDSVKLVDKGISTGDLQDTVVTGSKIDTHAIDTSKLDVTNTGSAGQVLTKAVGANGQFTWATDQTGGGSASRMFVDTGDGTQAAVATSDSMVIQGDSTIQWRFEDQARDTINPTIVKIPDGAVTGTAKIATGAVELADLATGSVDSAKILDKGISTGDLQDTVVTLGKLKSASVDSIKLIDKGISTADLQDTVVTTAKLKGGSVDSIKILDKGISTADIQDTAVTTAKIKGGAVDSVKILDKGISTADLQDTVVTLAKMKSASVDSIKLVDKGISTGDVQDTAITLAKLKSASVDSIKLVDKGISTGDLQDTAVTTAKIKSGAITTAKLLDGDIQPHDVDEGTAAAQNDVPVRGAADNDFDWIPSAGTGRFNRASMCYGPYAWQYSSTTTDTDPTAGILKMNNTSIPSVTFLYVDTISLSGVEVGDSTFAEFATNDQVWLEDINNPSNAVLFRVTGGGTNGTGYWKIPVAVMDSATTGQFTNTDTLTCRFIHAVNQGSVYGIKIGASNNATDYAYFTGSEFTPSASYNFNIGASGAYWASGFINTLWLDASSGGQIYLPARTSPNPGDKRQFLLDTNDYNIAMTDGSVDYVVGGRDKMFSIVLDDPPNISRDTIPILTPDAPWAPNGIVITKLGVAFVYTSTDTVKFAFGTRPDSTTTWIDTLITSASREVTSTTFNSATIAAGSWLSIVIDRCNDAGNIVTVWGTYYVRVN